MTTWQYIIRYIINYYYTRLQRLRNNVIKTKICEWTFGDYYIRDATVEYYTTFCANFVRFSPYYYTANVSQNTDVMTCVNVFINEFIDYWFVVSD